MEVTTVDRQRLLLGLVFAFLLPQFKSYAAPPTRLATQAQRQTLVFDRLTAASNDLVKAAPEASWKFEYTKPLGEAVTLLHTKIYNTSNGRTLPPPSYDIVNADAELLERAASLGPIRVEDTNKVGQYKSILVNVTESLKELAVSPYATIKATLITEHEGQTISHKYYVWYVVAKLAGMPGVAMHRTSLPATTSADFVKNITYRFIPGKNKPDGQPQDVSISGGTIELPVPK